MIAQSGEEALRLALKNDFAVILLDVPHARSTASRPRVSSAAASARASTPIIFLTAAADE